MHWSSCPRQRPIDPHRCGRVRVRVRVPAGRNMSLCVRAWVAARLLAPAVGHANGYLSNSFDRPQHYRTSTATVPLQYPMPLTQAVAVFEHLGQTPDPAIKKVAQCCGCRHSASTRVPKHPEHAGQLAAVGCSQQQLHGLQRRVAC